MSCSGRIPSHEPTKLVLRLAKHWDHKFRVTRTADTGAARIELGSDTVELEPHDGFLDVHIAAADEERMKSVVVSHLERFARGAPVEPVWQE